jgi:hypothetical protein
MGFPPIIGSIGTYKPYVEPLARPARESVNKLNPTKEDSGSKAVKREEEQITQIENLQKGLTNNSRVKPTTKG